MRNFDSSLTRLMVAVVAAWLLVCVPAAAQAPPTVKARFEAAAAHDERVRLLLTNMTARVPASEIITQVTQAITSFESLVRRYPTSSYADNALWHAASLADTSYQRFNRAEDRDRALRLYRWLAKEYPTSPLVKQANAKVSSFSKPVGAAPAQPAVTAQRAAAPPQLANLSARPTSPAPVEPPRVVLNDAPTIATVTPAPAPPPSAPAPVERATLVGIQRTVLPDAVRITLELDREVAYHEERLSGPARLFFDLKNVQPTPALTDKVLSYTSDVVDKIRVGRRPDSTVRVVLDLEDVPKYSVFTLYSPFRLVIDAERATRRTLTTATVVAPASTEPAPVISTPSEPAAPLPSAAAAAPAAHPPPVTPSGPSANAAGGFSIARQLGLSVSRIVIDPGHGGHDPGTMARGLNEADLTLDVALRLEKLLQKEPGIEVVLTRRTDVYVPLEERTAIANRQNADLFLSIHVNSSRNASAKGIETYFLSFASSPEAEAVAARENSASEREMHQLPDIIKAIALNNKLDESRDLANMVQDSLVATLRKTNKEVRSRGVKKAPFVVLIGAAMPSVLAEISFITNRQELQLLKTSAYKDKIAQSLNAAVLRYRKSLKGAAAANTVER